MLGFAVTKDVSMGEFRWLSVATPTQPELEITIQSVGGGPGVSEEDRAAIDTLLAKGLLTPLVFRCDDVDGLFEHVRASGQAEVLQEPVDQFYGVRDCAFRDPAGNMLRFNQALPEPGLTPRSALGVAVRVAALPPPGVGAHVVDGAGGAPAELALGA